MEAIILTITSLLLATLNYAQNAGIIKGSVSDNTSRPLTAATVSLLAAKDSSPYKTAVTDNTGTYIFEKVKPGSYVVKVSSVNHST